MDHLYGDHSPTESSLFADLQSHLNNASVSKHNLDRVQGPFGTDVLRGFVGPLNPRLEYLYPVWRPESARHVPLHVDRRRGFGSFGAILTTSGTSQVVLRSLDVASSWAVWRRRAREAETHKPIRVRLR